MHCCRIAIVFLIGTTASAQSVSRVPSSEIKDSVPGFSPSGSTTMPAVHIQLDISYPHGKKEIGDLTVVYDGQSGHYLWRYTAIPSHAATASFFDDIKSGREAIYADADGLVDLVFPQALFVKVYTQRAASLDEAVSEAINEIQQGLAAFEVASYHLDYRPIDLRKAITDDFRCAPLHANCQDNLNTIAAVGKEGSNWRLTLRNRFDLGVLMNQSFVLLSAQQLTQPKPLAN